MNRIVLTIVIGTIMHIPTSCTNQKNNSEATSALSEISEELDNDYLSVETEKLMGALIDGVELNDSICQNLIYALNTSDASVSEQLGYVLYNYFNNNTKRNNYMSQYIARHNINIEKFSLMFLTCISLENEYNSYNEFIKSFSMIRIAETEYAKFVCNAIE